jgi:hypothetical protein
MPSDDHRNFSYSAVATAPAPPTSGTSLVVATGQGLRFPTPPFNCTVWPDGELAVGGNAEIVRVTAVAADTFTITRTQEASQNRAILVGDQIAATITDKTLTDVEGDIAAHDTRIDTLEGAFVSRVGADTTLATLTNSATETTLATIPIPANTLGTSGLVIVEAVGHVVNNSVNSPRSITVKVKYGGAILGLLTTGGISPQSPNGHIVVLRGVLTAADAMNAQRSHVRLLVGALGTAGNPPSSATVADNLVSGNNALAVDSTTLQNLDVTVQWNAADAACTFFLHSVHVLRG